MEDLSHAPLSLTTAHEVELAGVFVEHYLPTIRSDKKGFTELAKLKEALSNSIDDQLIIDFSRCKFFDANLAASLKAVLSSVARNSQTIIINSLPQSIEYILRKNRFLNDYRYPIMKTPKQTTLPLLRVILPYHCFQSSDSRMLADYLNTQLTREETHEMNPMLNKQFRQSIFELFENCATHSDSNQGIFICGQYFPRLNRLDLTISDAGVGIRTNVRRYLNKQVSSVEAILWAMEQGNTTKTGSLPGGFGLALLKNLIAFNHGKIQIVSRKGYYEFSNGKVKFEKLDADFPGTTINLEINTNDDNNYCLSSETTSLENLF